MKRKHLYLALAILLVGAFVSVAAQTNFLKFPVAAWFSGSSPQAQIIKINPPAFNAAQPAAAMIHDNEPHYPTSGTFNNSLSGAQISEHQDGDLVVVMSAAGELPGTLTLKLHRENGGTTISGGEWAFLVSYTEEVHNENPEPGEPDHYENLVQRGTLKGTIDGGQVTLDAADGSVSTINSIQLIVNGGTLTFHEADEGSGAGQISNLRDNALSTGNLTLSF